MAVNGCDIPVEMQSMIMMSTINFDEKSKILLWAFQTLVSNL